MKSTWRLLRRTYWSVAKAVPAAATAADSPLPNWPDWIRSKCSDSLLQLVLHTLHEQDWKALASRRQAVKDDPVSRTTRIATRLGLIEEGSGKQPWTMFLYFELATLQTTRCMRDFAAAVSRNKTKSAQALLDALNKSAVERSPDSESPPWISVDDVKALIVGMSSSHSHPSTSHLILVSS